MDSLITDTALAVLVAAKGGLLKPVTDGVSQLVKTTGAKLWTLVTARFAKDGPGATQAMTNLEQHPDDSSAQKAVRRRLEGLLDEDPTFAAEIKAIIGELKIDQSVHQTAQAGDNSSITQVSGSHNTFIGKA